MKDLAQETGSIKMNKSVVALKELLVEGIRHQGISAKIWAENEHSLNVELS